MLLQSTYLTLFMKFCLCYLKSWECSQKQLAYSIEANHPSHVPSGQILKYDGLNPILVQHPCKNMFSNGFSPAIILGSQVFISLDEFGSSLQPLSIPSEFVKQPAMVTAVTFVQSTRLLIVINEQVFIYFYKTWKTWKRAKGIDTNVTQLSNDYCCYDPNDKTCNKISKFILAYDRGKLVSETNIYYSEDGGYAFQLLHITPQRDGPLISIYSFASISEIGMLINKTDATPATAYFTYGDIQKMNNITGTPIPLPPHGDGHLLSIIPPGLRGFITFWTKDSFVSSPNNGLTTKKIAVIPTNSYPNDTLPVHEKGICFVTASATEIAAVSKEHLFYGSLAMIFDQMVHIDQKNTSSSYCDVMMFENTGLLSIITPVAEAHKRYYNFRKCTINIQAKLMNLRPQLDPCPVEILTGDFHNKMYYIDMNQKLYFNVTFVPKPGTGAFPYVMVSNPHVLEFRASLMQDGFTIDGNTKYNLKIKLLEPQYSITNEDTFKNDTLSTKMSSITVDIYNKGIFCVDMHPLTALIVVDCPPKKHIKVVKKVTACHKELYNPRFLQNLTYTISREAYDPNFLNREHLSQENLNVTYRYGIWGCPLLLYYDMPWLPALELWENDEFVEHVSADFVIVETHGMHNFDYLLNEVEANCLSASQSWINMIRGNPQHHPVDAWSRSNYKSCKEYRGNESLPSVTSQYQVLNKNEANRILFQQYNGIYIFKVIVVDALYSYCDLTTIFSVYVHGALPKTEVNPLKTLISFLVLIFGSILMVYYFPKLMKENARMKSVWSLDLGL